MGVFTDIQIPLLTIDRRGVSIMSILFTNRRVTHLRYVESFEWIKVSEKKSAKTGVILSNTGTGIVSGVTKAVS